MRRTILTGVAIIFGVGAAIAADDPIKARQKLMDGNGDATKAVVPILKGQAPFNLATVQAALNAYIATSEQAPPLFAPGRIRARPRRCRRSGKTRPISTPGSPSWDRTPRRRSRRSRTRRASRRTSRRS